MLAVFASFKADRSGGERRGEEKGTSNLCTVRSQEEDLVKALQDHMAGLQHLVSVMMKRRRGGGGTFVNTTTFTTAA